MTSDNGCTADPEKIAAEQAAAQQRLAEQAAAAEEAANANKALGKHVCDCGLSVEVYPGHEIDAENALIGGCK